MSNIDINSILKQANTLKENFAKKQKEFETKEFIGTSGGGLIAVTLNGKGEMVKLEIDPKIISDEDNAMLTDLIVAAFNNAKKLLDEASSESNADFGANLNIPGLDKIF